MRGLRDAQPDLAVVTSAPTRDSALQHADSASHPRQRRRELGVIKPLSALLIRRVWSRAVVATRIGT